VYFCCLEALQNTAKHAGDTATATITASHDSGVLTVMVADNGCGFDPTSTARGAGLTNMADRIAVAGGALHVTTHPSQGTHIIITIPTPVTTTPPQRECTHHLVFTGLHPVRARSGSRD
jgi:signal transduction histidine kinase